VPSSSHAASLHRGIELTIAVEKLFKSPAVRAFCDLVDSARAVEANLMYKRLDLTGQRFGRWTVISLDRVDQQTFWLCRCDCGTESVVRGGALARGHSRSCGCLQLKRRDLTGQKFGRWTVVAFAGVNQRRNACWLCRCDCGEQKVVEGKNLRSGNSRSCGCLSDELPHCRHLTHGHTRDGSKSAEYRCWVSLIQRCTNPKNISFKNYGDRGIMVCSRWLQFANFLADMGPKPSPLHSIDRFPDNDGHYKPSNCRWATRSEQNNNQRPRKKAA
jgi:hypothetical protein